MTVTGRKQLDDGRQMFYIDVGTMDPDKTQEYLEQIRAQFRNMQGPYKPISMMDDFAM